MLLPTHNRNVAHHELPPPHHEPPQHYSSRNAPGSPVYTFLRCVGVRIETVNLRCIRRWLLLSLVGWVLYGLFIYSHARNTLGSCVFDSTSYRQELFELDSERVQHSLRFLSTFASTATPDARRNAPAQKELCMVITTVDRRGARYLIQSAASVLRGLTEEQKRNSELLIVNADMKETTPAYQSDLELLQRIPGVEIIRKSDHPSAPLPFSEQEDAFLYWLAKERDDYVFGLEQCRKRNPKYILLFEDDVWAARNWYSRLLANVDRLELEWAQRRAAAPADRAQQAALDEKDEQLLLGEEAQRGTAAAAGAATGLLRAVDIRYERANENDWAVIKLYMAEQYDQYDLYLNNNDIAFFISWGVGWGLAAIAAYVAHIFLVRCLRRSGRARRPAEPYVEGSSLGSKVAQRLRGWRMVVAQQWNTLLCLFFIANIVPAAILFPVCVSKQNFFATRKPEGIHMSKSRCCAQAQFFKADPMFDQMVQCINSNDYRLYPLGVDLLVSDCARGVGGVVYETIPHLFQHTGIHSSSSVKRRHQNHHAWLPHMSVYFQEEE